MKYERKMSILTANLKHLYQRRGNWIFYTLLGFFIIPYFYIEYEELKEGWVFIFIILLAWIYFIGTVMASMQTEVLSKPFTYCLPSHRTIIWKFIIIAGLAISLLFSLFFIYLYSELDIWRLLPIVLSGFSIFLTFYLLGVCFDFLTVKHTTWLVFIPLFLVLVMFSGMRNTLLLIVERSAVFFIVIGILSGVVAYRLLTDDSIARRFCSKTIISFFEAWDSAKVQKKRQAIISEKGNKELETNPKVEQYFLTRIQKCAPYGIGCYTWGSLYTRFGTINKGISLLILIFLFVLLFLCYFKVSFVLFIFGSITLYNNMPLYSNMLISGGRKERFITTILQVVTNMVLVTTICTILAAYSMYIEDIMPKITLYGKSFPFQAADIRLFFIPLLIVPIASIFNLVLYRKMFFVMILNMLLLYIMVFLILIMTKHNGGLSRYRITIYIPEPEVVVALIALSWAMFVGVLYYICARRPLVR